MYCSLHNNLLTVEPTELGLISTPGTSEYYEQTDFASRLPDLLVIMKERLSCT